jgi:hypothetical protein
MKFPFPFSLNKSDNTIHFIAYCFVACSTALCASDKRFAASRAMIALTFCPSPFCAALLITMLSHFSAPYGNRFFHYS